MATANLAAASQKCDCFSKGHFRCGRSVKREYFDSVIGWVEPLLGEVNLDHGEYLGHLYSVRYAASLKLKKFQGYCTAYV